MDYPLTKSKNAVKVTELRYSIYQRFLEEGIEIPFRQQDVFIKNLDDISAALRGESRAADAAAKDPGPTGEEGAPADPGGSGGTPNLVKDEDGEADH